MPYYLVPTVNSTDASSETASAGSYVLAPYAQGIQKTDDVRDTVTIDSILTTSDQAYSKTNMQSSQIEKRTAMLMDRLILVSLSLKNWMMTKKHRSFIIPQQT